MLLRIIFTAWFFVLLGGCGSSGGPGPTQVDLEVILPEALIDSSGQPISRETLYDKFVGFYFSASWCPPCRAFTPKLVKFRNEYSSDFEVVLVGWDRSDAEQMAYVADHGMPWPALPNKGEHAANLGYLFGVQSIPTLIVISPSGKVVSDQGRMDVASQGASAFDGWLAKEKGP